MKHRHDDQEKAVAADASGHGYQIEDVVADYLQQCESGSPPDRDEFVGKYPDLRDELIEFLENQKEFSKLASPIREMQSAMSSWEQPESGKTVGDYEIIEEIGRGGMGVIYRARQISLQRIVALKMIYRGRLGSSNDVTRFYREAEAAAALDHPNIVPIIEVGEQGDHHFFAMKLAEGGSFEEAIKSGLTLRPSVHIVVQVARAIHHAHSKGILHRDLKPSNILIDTPAGDTQELDDTHPNVSRPECQRSRSNNEETIKALVTDFGLAKIQKFDGGLTATGTILGSPNYMSPEQANAGSDSELTVATDVHGLGSVLYFALVGLPPFRGADLVDVLNQVRDADPVPPRALNPVVDRDLETICLKCLEKSPNRRYGSAMAVADDLDRYLAGRPIEARPAGFVERSVKWTRREPKLSALAAVSALLILATIGGLFAINMLTGREKKKTEAALTQVTVEKIETQKALWRSFVSEARAHRWSGRQGYRFKAIESLENAISLHPEIKASPDQIRLVQNELVAALAVQFDATTDESHPLRVNNTNPFSFDFDPKLQHYALGHDNGAVSVYSMESRRLVAEVPPSPSQARIRNVRFDNSGSVLAVADEDGNLSLYRFDHHSLMPIWTSQCQPYAFDFCPKSNVVVVADCNRQVKFFNYVSGEVESQFDLEFDVGWLRTNGDGTRLLVVEYRMARVLDADSGEELVAYESEKAIAAATFTADGRQFAVARQNLVTIVDVNSGYRLSTFSFRGDPINLVSIPGSEYLMICENDGQTRVWKQGESSSFLAIRGFARRVDSESGKVGFRSDSSIGRWIVAQSKTLVLPPRDFWLLEANDITFSPNLGLCATSGLNGIQFWRTDTFDKLGELPLVKTKCIAFDPSNGSLVIAGVSGLTRWPIRLVGEQTLQFGKPQPFELNNQMFRPNHLAFSDDGSVLACSCDLDKISTILVFPAGKTQAKWKLEKELGEVNSLSVSRDGQFIAASNRNDQTVYVWNTRSGTLEAEIESSKQAITWFNATDDLIVSDVDFGTRRFQSGTWIGLGQISPDCWAEIDSPTTDQLYGVARHDGGYELLRSDFNQPLIELAYGEYGRHFRGRIKFSKCGTFLGAARDSDGVQVWSVGNIHSELKRRGIGWDTELQFNEPNKLPAKLELEFVFSDPIRADGKTFAVKLPSESTTPRLQRVWLESADGQKTIQFSNAAFFQNGERNYAGIPFHVTPDFVIASRYSDSQFSPAVNGILVGRKCKRLFFLQGAFIMGNNYHEQIGKYEIIYEDGTSKENPIRRRTEFPDWRVQHDFDAALDPIGDIVRTSNRLYCVVRVNSWTNPHPQKQIREVRLIATNPQDAPFCLAITGKNNWAFAFPQIYDAHHCAGQGESPSKENND